jgi:hypothetical protein
MAQSDFFWEFTRSRFSCLLNRLGLSFSRLERGVEEEVSSDFASIRGLTIYFFLTVIKKYRAKISFCSASM